MDNSQDDHIICHCSGTSAKTIKALISKHITDIDEISRKTGAVSGCGGCEYAILELLAESDS